VSALNVSTCYLGESPTTILIYLLDELSHSKGLNFKQVAIEHVSIPT